MKHENAKLFLEKWFNDVWVASSVSNLESYYSPNVVVNVNGKQYNRDQLIEHCRWGKENERISKFFIKTAVAENNVIAFHLEYHYSGQEISKSVGDNIGIMHLDEDGKIIKIDVKSSEQFQR